MNGRALCQHGHLHRNAEAARICDVAHRLAAAKRLDTAQLVTDLRAVLARAAVRNAHRGF
jgi:hypothetical protein